jgi:uncharacterized protein (TIGR03437 family)
MGFHHSLIRVLSLTLALAGLAAHAQQDSSPQHVAYVARLGWGQTLYSFVGRTAVDSAGNHYIAGSTRSADLPTTAGAIQPRHAGGICGLTIHDCRDGFVAKLDPQGRLLWLTYLGSTAQDSPTAVAVDREDNVYVAGAIFYRPGDPFPANFPFTSMQLPPAEGSAAGGFLVKISPDGERLLYAVPLPGEASAIAVHEDAAVYLTGGAGVAAPNTAPGLPRGADNSHLWIAKVNAAATRLEYSLLLGGNDRDAGNGIAVDSSGQAYICGSTSSADFPVTPGALQQDYQGGSFGLGDAFALKVNAAGTALVFSTYLGGAEPDEGLACALGPQGSLLVAGSTWGESFPTTPGAFQSQFQGGLEPELQGADGFVAKLDAAGSSLIYSTYLGGAGVDAAYAIAVDADGKAYVGGTTGSLNFPVLVPVQSANRGFGDAFVSVLNEAGSAVVFSTFLGGRGNDDTSSVSVNSAGEIFAGGYMLGEPDFPGTPGAFDRAGSGYWAARLSPGASELPLVYLDGIVNAASFLPATQRSGDEILGGVSGGELVTLFGQGLGPDSPLGVELDSGGRVSASVGGTRVLFGGIAAPLLYVSANQVNAVVPWSVEGKVSVEIEVERGGQRSAVIELPVVEAAPAFFTSGPWGVGQAAALNQDGTVNSRDNPAGLGSVVVLYATGLGPLDPQADDGEVIPIAPPYAGLRQPVLVRIGSVEAEVEYVGPAPGFVAGLVQINARIPAEIQNAGAVAVSLNAAGIAGMEIASIAVR